MSKAKQFFLKAYTCYHNFKQTASNSKKGFLPHDLPRFPGQRHFQQVCCQITSNMWTTTAKYFIEGYQRRICAFQALRISEIHLSCRRSHTMYTARNTVLNKERRYFTVTQLPTQIQLSSSKLATWHGRRSPSKQRNWLQVVVSP